MPTSAKASLVPHSRWLHSVRTAETDFSLPFLLSMTVVGGVLRLLSLTGQSLWVDEILTWNAIRPGGDLGFWEQVRDTIQGPLYLAVVWPLLHMQDTALMLRLPAAVAGVLAVPLFGWLAFRLLDGRAARLALLLFAVNPFHVWYSQEGRGYAFVVLFALVTALVYVAMVRRGPSLGLALGFSVAGAAMVLSNLSGVFVLLAMGLTLVTLHRPQGRRDWALWLLAFGLASALVAPWLLRAAGIWAVDRIVPGAGTGVALRGTTTFSPLALPYAFFTYFFGYSLGPSLRELHRPDRLAVLMNYLPVLAAGAALVGTALLAGVIRPDRRRLTLITWIAVPLLLAVLLAVRNVKPWNARYAIVVLPWLLALAGTGLARLDRRWGALVAVALIGLTLWSLWGYQQRDKYAKADIRGAAAWIAQAGTNDDTILVPVVRGVYRYYDGGAHRLVGDPGAAPLPNPAAAEGYLREKLAGLDSCWVVLAREWYFDPQGLLMPALAASGELELAAQLPGVDILLWRAQAEEAPAPPWGTRHGS